MSREHKSKTSEEQLQQYYQALYRAWGPQHWWPAETRFEVIVGAYLTQNTAWTNVELALANLRAAKRLSVEGIRRVTLPRLERLIRPSGYFRQKAQRLKTFVAFLDKAYAGSLDRMFAQPTKKLREELLEFERSGPRDSGFHSSLCGKSSGVRGGRLHTPHPRPARDFAGEERITRKFASCFNSRWNPWFSRSNTGLLMPHRNWKPGSGERLTHPPR